MSISSVFNIASSGINAASTSAMTSAHNIANVNTDGFDPIEMHYQTGSNGVGVEPVYPSQGSLLAPAKELARFLEDELLSTDASGRETVPMPSTVDPSATNMATEFVELVMAEHMVDANTKTISTAKDMLGGLINIEA